MKISPIRNYIIGSEWIYYKIYMGTYTTNRFITEILPDIIDILINKEYIDKWFFIRYYDTDSHIRIRFHLTDINNIGKVINIMYDRLNIYLEQKIIHKILIDSYVRELERYHYNLIEESENLFYINSEHIMHKLISTSYDEYIRWEIGVEMINGLLNSFKYDIYNKVRLLEQIKNDFGQEFGVNKNIRKQLNKKFHEKFETIYSIVKNTKKDEFYNSYDNIFYQINKKNKNNNIVDDLLYSYIHMLCNRLFTSNNRMNEWVLYDLLYQFYKKEMNKNKFYKKEESENL